MLHKHPRHVKKVGNSFTSLRLTHWFTPANLARILESYSNSNIIPNKSLLDIWWRYSIIRDTHLVLDIFMNPNKTMANVYEYLSSAGCVIILGYLTEDTCCRYWCLRKLNYPSFYFQVVFPQKIAFKEKYFFFTTLFNHILDGCCFLIIFM